ncbi:UDP-2,4-diacetamido-2,4,6-trideoxy-beta-L-altropyranose hydrolase [Alkalimonas collagenimarina]|uniref:UDP-2,4-diacetamido-2,4, 6-trideoxy-beta-L-altropyranose hydrolase n=1 Tax=Alkalimonas collagenimarina TaxID=400390 RepID=A0ABT9GYY6_9GAMM|nr:UDP-2,4-diacetamido-2,4,6-trideoxy-beta-L-altropyranose hydrolase [Alkalimonas collagenimarina]MDP4535900.1 UDP-2,4-diacetamido-2,4,6-trideoxy-beta-L-altropyranose hydrolase [Alkalimonas collagenimarina]
MRILFRVDSSALIGLGHLMRCLTLAEALRDSGYLCHFICRPHAGHSAELVQQRGFELTLLPSLPPYTDHAAESTEHQHWLGCTEQQDATDCQTQLSNASEKFDLLVVDHYALAAEFCSSLRPFCRHILMIDDLANRAHDCDWLLDQNLLPDQQNRYQQLVPAQCSLLLGPQFALLRHEFYQVHPVTRQAGRLLVFFGGNDPFHLTIKSAIAIAQLTELIPHADIVISAQHPDRSALEALCQTQATMQLHIQSNDMASLMHQAQLMLGAGGTTHWERCICALPALVVTVANNQLATTRYLHELGACSWLGDGDTITQSQLEQSICDWLGKPEQLRLMGEQAKKIMASNQGARTILQHLKV